MLPRAWLPVPILLVLALPARAQSAADARWVSECRERGDDWERDRSTIRALAGAGATWWIEYIPVGELEGMRASVKRGPLHVD